MGVAPSTSPLNAHGTFPSEVWRIFDCREHAEALVRRGEFRLSELRNYRIIPNDARRDPEELTAAYQTWGTRTTAHFAKDSDQVHFTEEPGWATSHSDLLTPTYSLCCSLPSADPNHLRAQFGWYRVRILDPRRLAKDMCDYLSTLPWRFAGGVEGCVVEYNNGGPRPQGESSSERFRLTCTQKPSSYRADCEYRYVAISLGSVDNRYNQARLPIVLNRPLDYLVLDEI